MKAPITIWLQWHGDADPKDYPKAPRPSAGDISWCEDNIFEHDVRYVRADLVAAALPQNWTEDKEWRALAKALGLTPNAGAQRRACDAEAEQDRPIGAPGCTSPGDRP